MGRYDSIIVGSSYAGLAAASQMPGRQVLILERHDSVVNKNRGSLGLHLPLGQKLVAQDDSLVVPLLNLRVEGGVRGRIERIQLQGRRERTTLSLSRPWLVLDERRIKGALFRHVLQLGADVRVSTPVREVHTDGRQAYVRADDDHQARVLVGADGSQSLVAHSLHLKREKLAVMFQREAELGRMDLQPGTLFLQAEEPGSWFVAIAFSDRCLASVMQIVGPRGVPQDLDERLSDRIERMGGGQRLSARAAIVRINEPAQVSYRDNIVLTGDALASYNFSSIAGAMTMGVLCGGAVQRFLAGSHYALPDYHKRWRKAMHQGVFEQLKWISPLLGRIQADRFDRVLRSLRKDSRPMGIGSIWWKMPEQCAITWLPAR